jgi:hypothetical protein
MHKEVEVEEVLQGEVDKGEEGEEGACVHYL